MRALLNFLSVATVTVVLAACGGGGGNPVTSGPLEVATQDAVMNANSTNVAGLVNVQFNYPSGVPAFGTTGATTLTFTSSGSAPGFTITSGGNTAVGTTAFGASCVFTVKQSTFVAPSPLAAGNTITVSPCTITANTNGETADWVPRDRFVYLLLGTALSAGATAQVSVGRNGEVLINGFATGVVVTVVHVTGA